MKKQSIMLKKNSHQELTLLNPTPHRQKAQNCRKILKINEAIKSIVTMGNMQKMELIAINNRSLFNYSKVKRAEWTNRKHSPEKLITFPNVNDLKIDSRKIKNSSTNKRYLNKQPSKRLSFTVNENQLYERYIEQYVKKLKYEKRFDILANRSQLIQLACKQIHERIESDKEAAIKQIQRFKTQSEQVQFNNQIKIPFNIRKNRSITEVQYNQQINRINRSNEFHIKERALNEKLFLRKIKQLKKNSHRLE